MTTIRQLPLNCNCITPTAVNHVVLPLQECVPAPHTPTPPNPHSSVTNNSTTHCKRTIVIITAVSVSTSITKTFSRLLPSPRSDHYHCHHHNRIFATPPPHLHYHHNMVITPTPTSAVTVQFTATTFTPPPSHHHHHPPPQASLHHHHQVDYHHITTTTATTPSAPWPGQWPSWPRAKHFIREGNGRRLACHRVCETQTIIVSCI